MLTKDEILAWVIVGGNKPLPFDKEFSMNGWDSGVLVKLAGPDGAVVIGAQRNQEKRLSTLGPIEGVGLYDPQTGKLFMKEDKLSAWSMESVRPLVQEETEKLIYAEKGDEEAGVYISRERAVEFAFEAFCAGEGSGIWERRRADFAADHLRYMRITAASILEAMRNPEAYAKESARWLVEESNLKDRFAAERKEYALARKLHGEAAGDQSHPWHRLKSIHNALQASTAVTVWTCYGEQKQKVSRTQILRDMPRESFETLTAITWGRKTLWSAA